MPSAVADPPADGRVLIVSNRLPVTVRDSRRRRRGGAVRLAASRAGCAGYYQSASATWIGWPGPLSPAAARPGRGSLAAQLAAHNLRLVELAPSDVEGYYDGFSNAVIWPLFHYLLDRIPLRSQNWDAYRRVNQRFADAVLDELQPGRPGVGARLPPDARARPRARALPGRAHRVLPAHPVSRARSVPHPAVAARAARWACSAPTSSASTRRRTRATSRAAVRAQCGLDAVARPRARGRPHRAPRPLSDGPRRRAVRAPGPLAGGARGDRAAPRRLARPVPVPRASIGSTTPRAFRAGCSRSSGCCSAIPACATRCG